MSKKQDPSRRGLVPLADRIRWATALRLGLLAAAIVLWQALPSERADVGLPLPPMAVGYLVLCLLTPLSPRVGRQFAIAIASAGLLADGLCGAILLVSLGGPTGMVTYLIVVHVMGVCLLMSFRSGIKVALWHSIAVMCAIEMVRDGVFQAVTATTEFPYRHYVVFLAAIWLTALTTSTFAATNERELKKRRFSAEVLHELAVALQLLQNADEIAGLLTRTMVTELSMTRGIVILADAVTDLAADQALSEANDSGAPVLLRRVVAARNPHLDRVLPNLGTAVVLPIPVDRTIGGWLVLEVPRRTARIGLQRWMLSTASQAASQSGLALARAMLVRQLRNAASTDGLTGVLNRRMFDEHLARELARAQRTGGSIAVALVDLDHFKRVNDEHGHLVGDEVLRVAASALQSATRSTDVVARYGGEEFGVVLAGVTRSDASAAAERLRASLVNAQAPVPISGSVGVAISQDGSATSMTLLGAADRALYRAKAAGRNRCEIESSGPADENEVSAAMRLTA
ncbi:MAG: Response regulator pleD [Frankiales bacterium]|nr:Response regulator pleD [Frankiales bacterium]